MDDLHFRVTELERRVSNMLLKGTVAEANYAKGLVRVQAGEITTGWIPWATFRAGQDRTWSAPDIGEQVVVLSASGETAAGVVMPALFSNASPPPADLPTITRTIYGDGTVVEHDREISATTITLPAAGTWTLKVGATVVEVSEAGITMTAPNGKVTTVAGGATTQELSSSGMTLAAPDVEWTLGGS